MPFFPEGEDPLGPNAALLTGTARPDQPYRPAPMAGEVVGAAMRQNNPIVSVINALENSTGSGAPDPNHNPLETIGRSSVYDQFHRDAFIGSRNEAETRSIMARIDAETRDRQTLDSAGVAGTIAQVGAGLLDPTILLPVGGMVRGVGGALSVVRSAAETAALGGLAAGVSEAALQASQVTRTPEESAFAIGSNTLLAGLIGGGAAAFLSKAERGALTRALDTDRRAITEGAGLPLADGFRGNEPRVIDGAALRAQFTDAAGQVDLAAAARTLSADVRAAIDEGRPVTVWAGGKPREIVAADEAGLRDATGQVYGPTHLAAAGDADRIEIGVNATRSAEIAQLGQRIDELEARAADPAMAGKVDDMRSDIARLERERDLLRSQPDAERIPSNLPAARSVGAAGADARELRPLPLLPSWVKAVIPPSVQDAAPQWLLRFSPTQRAFFKYDSRQLRRAMADLTEVAFEFGDNAAGLATSHGGPPIGRLVQLYKTRMTLDAGETLKRAFAEYRFGTNEASAPVARAAFDDLRGQGGDRMSFDAFKAEVSHALRNGDAHEVPQVAQVAQHIRREIFEPMEKRLVEAGLLGAEDIAPRGDKSFLSRVWNKQALAADRPRAVQIFTNWLDEQQAEKATSQARVQALADNRRTMLDQLDRLDGRLGTLQNRASLVGAQLEERSREVNAATKREGLLEDRATLIRESISELEEFISVMRAEAQGPTVQARVAELEAEIKALRAAGSDATFTVGELAALETKTATERALADRAAAEGGRVNASTRAREAGVASNRSMTRLDVLERRLGVNAMLSDLLTVAKANAKAEADRVTGLLEDEIRAWKGNSTAEAVSALKARDEAERIRGLKQQAGVYQGAGSRLASADSAVDRAVKRILASERDLSRGELADRANEIVDRILGGPDGRLSYDVASGGPRMGAPSSDTAPPRGSLNARDFAIPSNVVRDFLENDVEHVIGTYLRTLLPDLMLHERFGDAEMTVQFRQLNEEYSARVAAAPTAAARTKMEAERQGAIRDLAAVRDRIRGVYGWNPDAQMRRIGELSQVARAYNTVTDLGSAPLNSAADMAGAIFRFGFANTFRDAWAPFFSGMLGIGKLSGQAKRQAKAMQIAVETDLNLRAHSLSDVLETYRPGSKFSRGMGWLADKSQLVNGQAWFTDRTKAMAATVASAEYLRAASRIAGGSASPADVRMLAAGGIDAGMARRVWAEFSNGGGDKVDGVLLPNTGKWADREVRDTFEAAIGREADIAVVTPGLEKPLWLSNPVFALLGQFKSFTAATHEKVLIAGLQRRDANTLSGLVAAVGMGALSYKLYSVVSGRETSDNPSDWIKEGISRGGVLGWADEFNNSVLAKLTAGRVDMYRLVGAEKPLSRFQQRSVASSLLGPTFGKLEGIMAAGGATFRADWGQGDTARVRRLLPLQNVWWLRNAINEVEAGVNGAFGIPVAPARP